MGAHERVGEGRGVFTLDAPVESVACSWHPSPTHAIGARSGQRTWRYGGTKAEDELGQVDPLNGSLLTVKCRGRGERAG